MIWTTNTHSFSATLCQKTGKPCPMAQKMMHTLAQAMSTAADVTAPDFELTGTCQLQGCTVGCEARYVAGHDRMMLFCDVTQDADQAQLDQFANAMFAPDDSQYLAATGSARPSAMVQANRRARGRILAPSIAVVL